MSWGCTGPHLPAGQVDTMHLARIATDPHVSEDARRAAHALA
jgi:hypothetical protein